MRGSTYYRLVTLTPFVLPVAGLVAGDVLGRLGLPGAPAVTTLSGFLGVATWMGGLPYVLTAAIVLWRLRGAPVAAYRRAAWGMPLPYAALVGVIFTALAFSEHGADTFAAAGIGAAWAACGLGVGYFYVFLVQLLYSLLRRTGVIVDAS